MFPSPFAVYFWAGLDFPNALVPGLSRLQQPGFASTARIVITPDGVYRFDKEWEDQVAGAPFLPAVRSTQYQKAFPLPGLQTLVFTDNDSASFDHLFARDGSGPA
jgi:hypothetical protein